MKRFAPTLGAFSFHPEKSRMETGGLSAHEYGVYMRLIGWAWADGKEEPSLPADDPRGLAHLAGLYGPRERVSQNVLSLFTKRGGRLYLDWLTREWKRRRNRLTRSGLALPANARPGSREGTSGWGRTNPKAERRAILMARDGYRCVWCSATEPLTLDHVIPVALGGDDTDDNYQVLCRRCNARKGASESSLG